MKLDPNALVGQTLNGMWRIVRPIGAGGMGAIFEAVNVRLTNKRYAVKMLHPSIAQDQEVFQRFRREAEIASELGHDHIVEVHDFNTTAANEPYMVMEYLEGEDLARRIATRGPMQLEDARRVLDEICSGLQAAHDAGIVHRDLKPQNIFLCKRHRRDDFVKVVDFGVSKVRHSSSVVTKDHVLMGTPFYMSPEQADGMVSQIDHRTDVFALGAIMWEMLVGRMAFESPTPMGAMYKVVHVDPQEVHSLREGLPPAVSLVIRRALAKKKEERYESVSELAADFARAIHGIPPQVAPPALMIDGATPALPKTRAASQGQAAFAETATPAPVPFPANSVSTMTRAAGEVDSTVPPPPKRRAPWKWVGAVAVAAAAATAAVVVMQTQQSQPQPVKPEPKPEPKPAPPPVDPQLVKPLPAPPQPPEPVEPAKPVEVGLSFEITPASARNKATVKIDGKKIDGLMTQVPKSDAVVTVVVEAPGFQPATIKVTPDAAKAVPVTLTRPRTGGGHNSEFGTQD